MAPLGRPAGAEAFRLVIALSLGAMAVAAYDVGRAALQRAGRAGRRARPVTRPALVAGRAARLDRHPRARADAVRAPALLRRRYTLDAHPAGRRRAAAARGVAAVGRGRRLVAVERAARTPRRIVALALAAPVLWCATDLLITGDPLFSLTGTRALAEELNRPRTAPLAPLLVPRLITAVIGLPVMLAGAFALVALSEHPTPRFKAVLAVLGLALATFVVIGAAGLPLLARYLLPAAALLAILGAGVATTRTRTLLGRRRAACLLVAIPGTRHGARRRRPRTRAPGARVQADLRTLDARPASLSVVTSATSRSWPTPDRRRARDDRAGADRGRDRAAAQRPRGGEPAERERHRAAAAAPAAGLRPARPVARLGAGRQTRIFTRVVFRRPLPLITTVSVFAEPIAAGWTEKVVLIDALAADRHRALLQHLAAVAQLQRQLAAAGLRPQ